VANVPLLYFEDTRNIKTIYPVDESKKPIVFNIVGAEPYLFTVNIQSFLNRVKSNIQYDVIILHEGLSEGYVTKFKTLYGAYENIRISFIDTKYIFATLQELKLKQSDARLLLPWILTEYSNIVCINWNTLFRGDIEQITDMEIEPVCIAGSRDVRMIGKAKALDNSYELFIKNELGIDNVSDLIDTDMFYMNLDRIRSKYTAESILGRISKIKGKLDFGEYVNMLYGDRKIIDSSLCVYYTESTTENNIIKQVPLFIFNDYNKAKFNPIVTSYSPELLWDFEGKEFIDEYWGLAVNTGYYHKLICYYESYLRENNINVNKRSDIPSRVRGGIQCVKDHGIIYTVFYLNKKLKGFFWR
jgi:lipopolysaccharide biosynthesis glycosyltransferase